MLRYKDQDCRNVVYYNVGEYKIAFLLQSKFLFKQLENIKKYSNIFELQLKHFLRQRWQLRVSVFSFNIFQLKKKYKSDRLLFSSWNKSYALELVNYVTFLGEMCPLSFSWKLKHDLAFMKYMWTPIERLLCSAWGMITTLKNIWFQVWK